MFLTITSYNLLKDSVESEFIMSLSVIKNDTVFYKLKYPSNPILDCQIINLHDQPLKIVIEKIHSLIEEDEFGLQSRIELIQLKNWLSKVINLFVNNNLYY